MIIGGSGDFFDGSLLGLDTLSLAASHEGPGAGGRSLARGHSADALFGARALLGNRFLGGVLNKVPLEHDGPCQDTVRPFLEQKGVPVFGVFPRDKFLESVTVAELNEILNGKVLCCDDRLDEFVENFLIGAMDVDSALNYFRRTPNKAVITGAHRSDIQLAALETSTKCIILTGGLQTNEVVLGKAQSRGVPILSVPDDTFSAINKIELRMGKSSILDSKKMGRTQELITAGFDMYRFSEEAGQGLSGKKGNSKNHILRHSAKAGIRGFIESPWIPGQARNDRLITDDAAQQVVLLKFRSFRILQKNSTRGDKSHLDVQDATKSNRRQRDHV